MSPRTTRSPLSRLEIRSRRRLWPALLLIPMLTVSATTPAVAESPIEISTARWIDEPGANNDRLLVEGHSTTGATVVILDFDSTRQLGRAQSSGQDWTFERLGLRQVPCIVAATSAGSLTFRPVEDAPADCGPTVDLVPTCQITPPPGAIEIGSPVTFTGVGDDPEGGVIQFSWHFGGAADATLAGRADSGESFPADILFDVGNQAFTVTLTVADRAGQTGLCSTQVVVGTPPVADRPPVPQQPPPDDPRSQETALLAFNDLGMHCADLGSAPLSILPPFNVPNSQVFRRGDRPELLDDATVELRYSAAANPSDPVVATPDVEPPSINSTSSNYPVGTFAGEADIRKTDFWDPVDPADPTSTRIVEVLFGQNPPPDEGLATLHNIDGSGRRMPGITEPYTVNDPQPFSLFQEEFGWFKAEGVPITDVDDYGRLNSYPLMRVEAVDRTSGQVLAAIDAVLPVSTEVDCRDCHTRGLVGADSEARVDDLGFVDPANATDRVDLEFAAKTNALLLHDFKHQIGADGFPTYEPPLADQGTVLCAACHNSFALEEVTGGGIGGDPTLPKMSEVMHGFHGKLKVNAANEELIRDPDGEPILSVELEPGEARLLPVDPLDPRIRMEDNCFSCHPGKITQCFRGAMFAAGLKCSNCHGDMLAMGGVFAGDFDHNGEPRTRLPWRDEPRCESCHLGDALNPGKQRMLVSMAFDPADPAAVPLLARNRRFAENRTQSPIDGLVLSLYRNSTDNHGGTGRHSGVACEGCHGSPHAIWPNPLPGANDNVAAVQLQGHAGTVRDCTVCHLSDSFPDGTLDGPHGMHPVNDPNWIKSDGGWHKTFAKDRSDGDRCAACHGINHLGTRLSRVPVDRQLRDADGDLLATVKAGEMIACDLCHDLEDSFEN